MKLKLIWQKIVDWYKTDPDEKEEEEEFKKLADTMNKRCKYWWWLG